MAVSILFKKKPKKGLTIAYLEVKELRVKLIFNENIIKLKNDVEYIKEAADAVAILCAK